jgi:tetraacyldisaccharide 4'-kinase
MILKVHTMNQHDQSMNQSMTHSIDQPIKSPTKLPKALTRLLSYGYRAGIGFNNKRFDRGMGVRRVDRPVISIGNISTGGTGKTPLVHYISKLIQDHNKVPAIAMRGYKAPPGQMGDEEREHREAIPGIQVVAQPDRYEGLVRLFKTESGEMIDCVVLDDGFQHRQLARDLDLVLIDASSPPYQDALLPRGFLREPVESLHRADLIVVTHREMVDDHQYQALAAWLSQQCPSTPFAVTRHTWDGFSVYEVVDGELSQSTRSIEELNNERVLGACAIGNPGGFFRQINHSGLELVEQVALRDHGAFTQSVIENLSQIAQRRGLKYLCVTRKDWVKIREKPQCLAGIQVIVPTLAIDFEQGEEAVRDAVGSVF